MIDHDVKPGPLTRCQICGSNHLHEVIDLGHQPLCDALLSEKELQEPEVSYPLKLMQCHDCTLAQLSYVISGHEVYPPSYPYRAGISWPVVEAHRAMAEEVKNRFGGGRVVDIGSNDGTLLAQFKERGFDVVGVEPTDIADLASVLTIKSFFTEAVADRIGNADVVTMTNVFAHMAELGEVMRGVCRMLAPTGVLLIENHYLLDIFDRNQFDSIYHEHVRTYTLKSLIKLFEQYGLVVFDVERVPRYGGNIRVFAGWPGRHPVSPAVASLLKLEEEYKDAREGFRARVYKARDDFRRHLAMVQFMVGCSAPGRASTLLNFYGLSARDILWTGELEGSLKIGKYLPGCHIPVVSNRDLRILNDGCEVVLLAWHYGREIAARLRAEGVKAKLFVPLPTFGEFQ